eukprot:6213805-Pleurochrysis_carterae.AAC.3
MASQPARRRNRCCDAGHALSTLSFAPRARRFACPTSLHRMARLLSSQCRSMGVHSAGIFLAIRLLRRHDTGKSQLLPKGGLVFLIHAAVSGEEGAVSAPERLVLVVMRSRLSCTPSESREVPLTKVLLHYVVLQQQTETAATPLLRTIRFLRKTLFSAS